MPGVTAGARLPATALLCVAAFAAASAGVWLARSRDAQPTFAACDPGRENCRVALPGGGELAFSLSPRPVRALVPLRVEAALAGRIADTVDVVFTGDDMNMGESRVRLTGAGAHFSGQAMLPVCVSGTMRWRADVIVTREDRQTTQVFLFEVSGSRT